MLQPNPHVAILGAGPTGLSAAIALACEGLRATIISPTLGGRFDGSPRIENIPGFPLGITGKTFNQRLVAQAQRLGVGYLSAETDYIWTVPGRPEPFDISLDLGRSVNGFSAVLIATGMDLLMPWVPPLASAGKDETVVVSGGGDAAAQVALGYAARGIRTVLAVRGSSLSKCSNYLRARLTGEPNLTVEFGTTAEQRNALDGPTVCLRREVDGQERVVAGTCHYLAGAKPDAEGFQVTLDGRGFVVTDAEFRTNRVGIYAAGDVRSGTIKRIAVAAGEGIAVGHTIARHLGER
jgi:thioredoxin reductase (NADPH)